MKGADYKLDIALSLRSRRVLHKIMEENPWFSNILRNSDTYQEAEEEISHYCMSLLKKSPEAIKYYNGEVSGRKAYKRLRWKDLGLIRMLDYITHSGLQLEDPNQGGKIITNQPIKLIWEAVHNKRGGARYAFFQDMMHLLRQISGKLENVRPTREKVEKWMDSYLCGLDGRIIKFHEINKKRILEILIEKMDKGEMSHPRFTFDESMNDEQKMERAMEWWEDHTFHLSFAIRDPELINEMLSYSLEEKQMVIMRDAQAKGIPFFVTPYYLSLLNVYAPDFAVGSDLAIRDYIFYSRELVEEFGNISAWEKEDIVEAGKPNAAGWILPTDENVHRRYPFVAILIPDNMGRACGGLCASCQRMYDFQRGCLNFQLDKLKPTERWSEKLVKIMDYFEQDSQLRDILITGGDALMASDKSLKKVLDAVYDMAVRKKEANKKRPDGKKYAELLRVRLGTRLPVYLPQRVNDGLIEVLREFKEKAKKIGIKQFVIQTHFESPLELTPASEKAVRKLLSAGWMVTNQLVFTVSASRRGHTSKLRRVLNKAGIITYYTFTVKGYMENYHNFATSARAVQEQMEEKDYGKVPSDLHDKLRDLSREPEQMVEHIEEILEEGDLPFLATDRNMLNIPAVGKSLRFRTIGITRAGRRILEYDHDYTRTHSPIIDKMGKMIIVESKPITSLLEQYRDLGEDLSDYDSLWGYSMGETETMKPVFWYPEFDFKVTEEFTNLKI